MIFSLRNIIKKQSPENIQFQDNIDILAESYRILSNLIRISVTIDKDPLSKTFLNHKIVF